MKNICFEKKGIIYDALISYLQTKKKTYIRAKNRHKYIFI